MRWVALILCFAQLAMARNIVVAVIDTGIDTNHPQLVDYMWNNSREVIDGMDNDQNGFVDDIQGWNFVSNNNRPTDQHGHGTHIAGIIVQQISKAQVVQSVKILPLKYFDSNLSGSENLYNSLSALKYAIDMNVDIINYSGGGSTSSLEEEALLELAEKKNILVVAAAGNESNDADQKPFYPANYGLSNVISVTAIDSEVSILPTSNYGKNNVDIAAPGKSIFSTLPGNKFGKMTGTSQATAYVSGLAGALLSALAARPDPSLLKRRILLTSDPSSHLTSKIKSGAAINLASTMSALDEFTSATGQPLVVDDYVLEDSSLSIERAALARLN